MGILIAFALQVFYDEMGEFPKITQNFIWGLIIDIVLLVVLILCDLGLRKSKNTSILHEKKSSLGDVHFILSVPPM